MLPETWSRAKKLKKYLSLKGKKNDYNEKQKKWREFAQSCDFSCFVKPVKTFAKAFFFVYFDNGNFVLTLKLTRDEEKFQALRDLSRLASKFWQNLAEIIFIRISTSRSKLQQENKRCRWSVHNVFIKISKHKSSNAQ